MKHLRMGTARSRAGREQGLSLVEVLVALAVSALLLSGAAEIYLGSKQSYQAREALAEIQQGGRFVLDVLAQDLRRAGYIGGNADISQIQPGTLDPPLIAPAGTCVVDTTWGRMLGRRVFGLNDTNAGYACIPNADYLRGDVLTVRYVAPSETWQKTPPAPEPPAGTFVANRLYLRSSLFEGRLFQGKDEVANRFNDTPQRTSELVAHAYYVGPSGRQCGGTAIPSLFREALDANGQPAAEEVVQGVEQLQVQYGVGGAGSVTQYLDADDVANWDDVVSARLWVLVRAACPETGYTNTNTYAMGDVNYDPNPDDGFRRQLYTITVNLRNAG